MNEYLARLASRSMTRRPTAVDSNIPPSFPPLLGQHDGPEPGADALGGAPVQPRFPTAETVTDSAALADLPPDRVTRAALPLAASEAVAEREPPAEPVTPRPETAEVVRVEPMRAPWLDAPASQPSGSVAPRTFPVPARPRDASDAAQPAASVEPAGSTPGDGADRIAAEPALAASSSGPTHDTSPRSVPDIEHLGVPRATGSVIVAAVPDLVPLAAVPAPSPPPLASSHASDLAPIDVHIGTIEIVAEPAPPPPAAPPHRQRPGLDAYARLRSYDWDYWL